MLFASVFVVMTGYGITLTVLPYYAERVHGLSGIDRKTVTFHVGLLTSVYAFAQLIASPIVGRIGDRIGRRPVLLAGLAGMAVTQATFGFVPQLWALYGLRILGGIATSGMLVAATTYVADTTADGERTRGMAWFGTAVSLGLVAGPALGGVLSRPGLSIGRGAWRLDGYSLPFLVAGALAFAVLVAALRGLPESMMSSRATGRTGNDRPTTGLEPHPGLRPLLLWWWPRSSDLPCSKAHSPCMPGTASH
ncbi:MAG: MFS transporter [Acidimicrobiia bacterium]